VLANRCVLSGEHVTDASSLTCANERLTHVKLFVIHDFVTLPDDGEHSTIPNSQINGNTPAAG